MKVHRKNRAEAIIRDLSPTETKKETDVFYTMEEYLPKYGWVTVPLHGNDEFEAQKAISHRRTNAYWVDKVRVCRVTREVVTVLTTDQPKKVGLKIKLRKK